MKEHLFIIGREPELSVAELEAAFQPHSQVEVLNPEAVIVRTTKELPERFIDRLGGTVKMGEIVARLPRTGTAFNTLTQWLTGERMQSLLPTQARDVGFSVYGGSNSDRERLKPFGLDLKKQLRSLGRPIRLVVSKEPQLSAVTVQRQGLIKHGLELLVASSPTEVVVARTTAVQDYQGYSIRDYGRPAADPKRGMIPPKLAQMMLNLVRVAPDDVLFDPFCGVGTVLQEGALLGVREIHGCDIDQPVVKEAQENIRWLFKEFPKLTTNIEITRRDAREMAVHPTVIVTEPDLGRPMRGHEPASFLEKEARRLETLYFQVLSAWKSGMQTGGRVAMLWPEFQFAEGAIGLDLDRKVVELGWIRQPLLTEESAAKLGIKDRMMLEYAREQARVKRQVRVWIRG